MGIIRRASAKEKELPRQLKQALLIQSELIEIEDISTDGELKSYHINQRNETIDLNNISGALLASQNMQMQTFVKEPIYCLQDQGGSRMDISENICGTLLSSMGGHIPIVANEDIFVRASCQTNAEICKNISPTLPSSCTNIPIFCDKDLNPQKEEIMVLASTKPNAEICINISPTLTASSGSGGGNTPLLFENHGKDSRYKGPLEVAPTITTSYGTGGNNVPLVTTENAETYCIASNTINRENHHGGNGKGFQKDISYTITTSDIHAIYNHKSYQDIVGTLLHRDHKGVNTCYVLQDKCIVSPISNRNLVRRLTPLECERLQGFPDGWTEIEKCSDSARYKALGNSVAIPCVENVMRGIAYFLKKQYELNEESER